MEALKDFRKANNLTQDELGAFLGVQKSFISKIENGREHLPADKLRKLMANENGWDTTVLQDALKQYVMEEGERKRSMIEFFDAPRKEPDFYRFRIPMPSRKNSKDEIIESLRAQNADLQSEIGALKARLEKAEMERQQFLDIIKRLTDK